MVKLDIISVFETDVPGSSPGGDIMDNKTRKIQEKAFKKAVKAKSKHLKLSADGLKFAGIDLAKRSTEAAERNARIRMWQLVVAILAGIAVLTGVIWQIFSKAS